MNGKIWADYLLEVTKEGRTVWEWRTWEHLDPAEYPITFKENVRSEWTHGNAVVELADGNLLIGFRNISTIVKIDRKSCGVVWKLGAPTVSGQHAPTPLPNGNILVFENGPHRWDQTFPFSRVIEVNPAAIPRGVSAEFLQRSHLERATLAQRKYTYQRRTVRTVL